MPRPKNNRKKKEVKITCRGADTAALENLVPFQGDLKYLSEENYQRLREAILRYGFSFPFAVWKNGGKLFLEDGHQREKVLRRMKQEGFRIPPLPIDYIEAKNEKEAKEKILLATSQFGEMTNESLRDFLADSVLDFGEIKNLLVLPQIDLAKFEAGWIKTEIEDQSGELHSSFEIVVSLKNEEEQVKLLDRLITEGFVCRPLIT